MKLQPNLEARQRTVGTVEDSSGNRYEIDWWHGTDKNGEIVDCEDFAFVFQGDEQLTDFVNPDWERDGWKSIEELMSHARLFILSGAMAEKLNKGGA